ncbi:MAG: hypothetical protein ABI661_00155 [Gammaproteobacteria bacterium]
MSFAPRASLVTAAFFLLILAGGAQGVAQGGASAAGKNPAPPKLSALHARVAQGGKVDLAASGYTQAQLEALRPNYQFLKPRARSNAE